MDKIITLNRLNDFLTNLKDKFVDKTDANSTYATKADAADTYENNGSHAPGEAQCIAIGKWK